MKAYLVEKKEQEFVSEELSNFLVALAVVVTMTSNQLDVHQTSLLAFIVALNVHVIRLKAQEFLLVLLDKWPVLLTNW